MAGHSGVRMAKKIARALEKNPWLGEAYHVERFRRPGMNLIIVAFLVLMPILLWFFGSPPTVVVGRVPVDYVAVEATMVGGLGLLVWYISRPRMVICRHGVLFGPATVEQSYYALPYDGIDFVSLTKVQRFWLLGPMGVGWLGNGSSTPGGKWGIVFCAERYQAWDKAGTVLIEGNVHDWMPNQRAAAIVSSFSWNGFPVDPGVFIFGTRQEPSRVVKLLLEAAAEHGCQDVWSVPAAHEPPVVLTGHKRDLVPLLPRVFGGQTLQ